jgi:hypothetical protein
MREIDFERANTVSIDALETALRLAERRLRALTQVAGHTAGLPRKSVSADVWYEAVNAVSDAGNTLEAARYLVRKGRRTVEGIRRAG